MEIPRTWLNVFTDTLFRTVLDEPVSPHIRSLRDHKIEYIEVYEVYAHPLNYKTYLVFQNCRKIRNPLLVHFQLQADSPPFQNSLSTNLENSLLLVVTTIHKHLGWEVFSLG